jgi:isoleucyl-tRNA synthetase
LNLEDVEIGTKDIPGWSVAFESGIPVALDLTITESLEQEGLARELVNRIQNLRKDKGFAVTDRIALSIVTDASIKDAVTNNLKYICAETLAESLDLVTEIRGNGFSTVELVGELTAQIDITKLN